MRFTQIVQRGQQLAQTVHPVGPLLARLTVGYAFIESGYGKVTNLDKVTEFFTELNIPAPALQAVFVSNVELLGGALVLLGFLTRLISWPLVGVMLVALITAKSEDVHSFSDLVGTIEWTYLALLTWLGISGAGLFSLDHLFYSKVLQPHLNDAATSASALGATGAVQASRA
jgi:putative oxidoreductase